MTKNTSKNTRKPPNIFKTYYVCISQNVGFQFVGKFRKDGHRTMMKNRLENLANLGYETDIYQKAWMDFSNMVPIFTRKHKMEFWQFGIFGNFGINGASPDGQWKNGNPGGHKNEIIIFLGPNKMVSPSVLNKNGNVR